MYKSKDARREPPPPVILLEGDFLELGEVEAKALVPFEALFPNRGPKRQELKEFDQKINMKHYIIIIHKSYVNVHI